MRVGLLGGDYHIAGNIVEEMFYDFVRNTRFCSLNSVILFIISVVLFRGDHL